MDRTEVRTETPQSGPVCTGLRVGPVPDHLMNTPNLLHVPASMCIMTALRLSVGMFHLPLPVTATHFRISAFPLSLSLCFLSALKYSMGIQESSEKRENYVMADSKLPIVGRSEAKKIKVKTKLRRLISNCNDKFAMRWKRKGEGHMRERRQDVLYVPVYYREIKFGAR
ncbi:hypothetical protein Cgig2_001050 [Carnegiea gigantea]|uniref:Uncharacterized protein n=1 Tax=Carnegiea gigantea TaxID=171969 RepID=A0A9Q1Q565_9CARY|nr:hypothetical protein Cgig2_001050 [Carnegiea gigantea]